jgi:hypothetical protein
MLKRTIGRLLITLLVITGLAGTLKNGSISLKERKKAINLIKNSRLELLNSIKDLSPRQLKYKPGPRELSIGELIAQMVSVENKCSDEIKAVMNEQPNPENRLKIALTDDQLLASDKYSLCSKEKCGDDNKLFKNTTQAINQFNDLRDHHIKYIRTSTEDLRNHVVKTFAGWIDCYQYYLLIADRSSYIAGLINQIKSSPRFPAK